MSDPFFVEAELYVTGEKARGHDWQRTTDGQIDWLAFDADPYPHNGPRCTRCGYEFCHHCHAEPQIDCPAREAA